MTEVYSGYNEKFLTGKELKEMYQGYFYCSGRHHETVFDITIPEYLTSINIKDDMNYRIFYNNTFCRVMKVPNDKYVDFFAFTMLNNTIYENRYLQENKKVCPLCNDKMIAKRGQFGIFWSCIKYPDCKGARKMMILGNFGHNGFRPCNIDE